LRCAVWFSQLGFSSNSFEYPYEAQSPVTGKKVFFEKDEDVLSEIENVLNQKGVKKYGIGQTLYYEMPFFTNPIYHIRQWCWDMIEDYKLSTKFNVPIATDLDSVDVFRADCFNIIEQEIQNINNHKAKDG
tara:strand:+ start:519 stop:911 length:393 start_codon:yes stop_codon:yes gene_type:complete